jgi:hypothetical protein
MLASGWFDLCLYILVRCQAKIQLARIFLLKKECSRDCELGC